MRPLLVANSDLGGGAARAGYRLHSALRTQGVDSSMLVRTKLSDDRTVEARPLGAVRQRTLPRVEAQVLRLQRPAHGFRSVNALSTGFAGAVNQRLVDVVDVHWIGMGTMSVRELAGVRHPLVMTLHDMWGFCGTEHYAPEDESARWRRGYRRDNRPAGQRGLDLDRLVWRRKRQLWQSIPVVCPSNWLADCARSSALMSSWPIHVVPYAMDLSVFQPHDRGMARGLLGLPMSSRLVLFGADGGGGDPRKGFDLLVQSLSGLESGSDIELVVFGQGAPEEPTQFGLPTHWMGKIGDPLVLALLYSAADLVVVPSRQDNLPQTATEAQSCGTPVVAFRVGGLPDAVDEGRTGALVEPYSAAALARAVSGLLDDDHLRLTMGARARERAVRLWNPAVIARAYVDVYAAAAEAQGRRDHR